MNLPNKLTILRVILVPFFIFFLLFPFGNHWHNWIALAIYVIASFTDLLDGYLARKNNLVTTFGKFMDPVADKLLVCSALICFVRIQRTPGEAMIPCWIVIILIAREFIINGLRLVAAGKGVVIAAGMSGKIKTNIQMITLGMLIGNMYNAVDFTWFHVLEQIGIYGSLVLSIYSLGEYVAKNYKLLFDEK